MESCEKTIEETVLRSRRSWIDPSFHVSSTFQTASKAPQAMVDAAAAYLATIPTIWYSSVSIRIKSHQRHFVRCQSFDEVHDCFREPGIINGYRSADCSALQAFFSIFCNTNETMNVWTHFLPFLYFSWMFFDLSMTLPLFTDEYYYPFVCYLVTACGYPLMSAVAHAFSCVSLSATHVCYFMDYATLSLYSWGCALLYYNYIMPTTLFHSSYAYTYLPIAFITSLSTTVMACCSRFYATKSPCHKILRLLSFVIPYVWVSGPLIFRLLSCDQIEDSCNASGIHHIRQFAFVLLAAFFYGSHLPERLAPGHFDFLGHSHNLLHIFSTFATSDQLKGALIDLESRKSNLVDIKWTSNLEWITLATPITVFINIIVIAIFTIKLVQKNESKMKDE